jgi:hypothetical protein
VETLNMFTISEIREMLKKLLYVSNELAYLNRPIVKDGKLHKNERGRYELGGYEFTCGYGIEILVKDDNWKEIWVLSRIEQNGTDYYAVDYKNMCLQGVRARIRGPK